MRLEDVYKNCRSVALFVLVLTVSSTGSKSLSPEPPATPAACHVSVREIDWRVVAVEILHVADQRLPSRAYKICPYSRSLQWSE